MQPTSPSPPPPRRTRRARLALRLALGLGTGAAAVLLGAAWWSVGVQRQHLTGLVHAGADRDANVILRSIRDAMLRNDPEGARRILHAIGAQEGIERIRILDKQGRIRLSTRPEEAGTVVDQAAEQCTVCHQGDGPLEKPERPDRMRVYERPDGRRVLAVIAPVPNEPECSTAACHAHDPAQRVLGVLDVQLPLGPVDAHLGASEKQMAFGILAAVLAMLGLTTALAWRLVLRPVRRLRAAVAAATSGDLAARAPVTSTDEIGELTGAWNTLVSELERARSELETWNRTLEVRVEETTRELEKAHRNLAFVEKMASLGKLAAVVAHEINNPLAGIATYARLLRRRLAKGAEGRAAPDAETERALELVETEAVRCGDIVKNLLLFSRAQPSRFAAVDLRTLLDRCILLVRHQAELQQVRVAVDVAPDLPLLECDGAQVQQAILALATNAIEAMPAGGQLSVRARRDDDQVLLQVADTGTGIEEKDLPHVFEPFFTTKEQGKGVGLGLAVVYGIVTRHHGSVHLDTQVGRGTTFSLRFPTRQPAPAEPVPAGAPS